MEVVKVIKIRYAPFIRWSQRNKSSGYFKLLKKRIKQFLELSQMLNDVLGSNNLLEHSPKPTQALINLSTAINNRKQKEKHHFIRPLRLAGLSLEEAKELGYNISKDLWANCLNTNERNLGGRPQVPNLIITEIRNHMEKLSNIAANRPYTVRQFAPRDPGKNFQKKKNK